MLTTTVRHWLCGVPQPGWGGTTLDGYVETVGMRPEISGDDAACKSVLDALVDSGYVRLVDPKGKLIKDPDAPKIDLTTEPRWELTEHGHDELTAPIESEVGAEAHEVVLELQPGVSLSKAEVATS